MKQTNIRGAIRRGSVFGLAYLILIIPGQIFGFFLLVHSLDIPIAIFGTICNICFITLEYGVLAIAQEQTLVNLSKYAKLNIALTTLLIISGAIGSILLFYKGTASLLPLALVDIPINISIGILNIRLAKSFLSLEGEYGKYAKNAAKWNRIGGWFVAIPFLESIGYFILIFGEYNVWQIVRQRAKQY